MAYDIVPLDAEIIAGEGLRQAANHLERLTNQVAAQGWIGQGLEAIDTTILTPVTPGTNGCLGLGSVPGMLTIRDTARRMSPALSPNPKNRARTPLALLFVSLITRPCG